jgi:hypothetical protein
MTRSRFGCDQRINWLRLSSFPRDAVNLVFWFRSAKAMSRPSEEEPTPRPRSLARCGKRVVGTVNCEAAPVCRPSKLSSQPRGLARAVEQGCNFRDCLFLGMVTLLKVWLKYEKNTHRTAPSCSCGFEWTAMAVSCEVP